MIHPESIPKHEAARYMGVKGEPSASVAELLDRLEPVVRAVIRPCYVFRETTVEHDEQGVHLGCMSVPLTGKSVAEHLKDCGKAVILAATLSSEADKLIRRLAVTSLFLFNISEKDIEKSFLIILSVWRLLNERYSDKSRIVTALS